MAHLFSSDLAKASSSDIIKSLDTASSEAQTFSTVIGTFREVTQSTLIGPGYNTIRNKMSLYQDALSKVAIISKNLRSNIEAANNTLTNDMEGYSELNTAELGEIEQRLSNARRILEILKTVVDVYEIVDGKKVVTGSRTIGSASQIAAYGALIRELEKLVRVLKKIEGCIASARGMISDSEGDSKSFVTAIEGITVTSY